MHVALRLAIEHVRLRFSDSFFLARRYFFRSRSVRFFTSSEGYASFRLVWLLFLACFSLAGPVQPSLFFFCFADRLPFFLVAIVLVFFIVPFYSFLSSSSIDAGVACFSVSLLFSVSSHFHYPSFLILYFSSFLLHLLYFLSSRYQMLPPFLFLFTSHI